MSAEEDRIPSSNEVSPQETEVDPQLSACAQDGPPRDVLPRTASNTARLAVGQLLSGRYRIERELGEGGMGVVYLAADEQVPGEKFAIKVLKEGLGPGALAQLREEVRKTRKLSHPNIVDVHSVNVDGNWLYVLMEYLEGKSLNALLDEEFGRGMPFSHAWPIIKDVGAALGYAHDHNVIHSDLKPANVFVTTAGRTKLLDFGIARVSRGPFLHAQSGPRALTPAYASCEMLEGKDTDQRDDIYSFACVIYEMLSGRRPFGDVDALEARETGARVQSLGVLTHVQNAALARALAFDRDGRTSSVEELLEGLAADQKRRRPLAVLGTAIIGVLVTAGLTYLVLEKLGVSRHSVIVRSATPEPQQARSPGAPVAAFNPPPHSIAVLPFVNMSGDPRQEYFSDGLAEELLNSLSRINELQVAARTSSFYFKGKDVDLPTIAHKLNVESVFEGSVRRSGNTVRITAELISAETGFHLWSETYDRDLKDVLKLQTEIATAVASALKVTLLGNPAAKIEVGGTHDPAAFDAYLRATKGYIASMWSQSGAEQQAAIAVYTEAIRLDPEYALAYAGRSIALSAFAREDADGLWPSAPTLGKAQADARKAIALAPDLSEGHMALAMNLEGSLDFTRASQEYARALALASGDARLLRNYGIFAVKMGQTEAALAALRRSVVLDPMNVIGRAYLGEALVLARRYGEAIVALREAPSNGIINTWRGQAYYASGNFESARAACDSADEVNKLPCLAITYDKLGRHADAEAMLAKLRTRLGEAGAVYYALIYAQWGDTNRALDWLETAMRHRDAYLVYVKTSAAFDPLRKEPRFLAIEGALKFPN
jgi:eukaryotic-like serine/threonine-protein kinase